MTGGAVKASKRELARLQKNQRGVKVDATIADVPDAAKVIAKLEKRIKKAESQIKMLKAQNEKMWKFYMENGGE